MGMYTCRSPKWGGVKTGVPFKDVLAIWNECAVSVQVDVGILIC